MHRVLLDNNAFPAIVSNDGETPSDLAEDNDIILNMIKEKIEEQHIDIEALKNAEENAIMEDAIKYLVLCVSVCIVWILLYIKTIG